SHGGSVIEKKNAGRSGSVWQLFQNGTPKPKFHWPTSKPISAESPFRICPSVEETASRGINSRWSHVYRLQDQIGRSAMHFGPVEWNSSLVLAQPSIVLVLSALQFRRRDSR